MSEKKIKNKNDESIVSLNDESIRPNTTESQCIPLDEQILINDIMGKKIESEGGQDSPTCVEDFNENGNTVLDKKLSINVDMLIEIYVKKSLCKKKSEKSPLSFIKENISALNSGEFLQLFQSILKYLQGLNGDKEKDTKTRIVNELLVNNSCVFEKQYLDNITNIYPIICKLRHILDFSTSPLFDKNPETAIYGVKIESNGSITYRMPLKCDIMEKIIEAEIYSKHQYLAGQRIHAIIAFSKKCLYSAGDFINSEIIIESDRMIKDIKDKVKTNQLYKDAWIEYLFSDSDPLLKIIDKNIFVEDKLHQSEEDCRAHILNIGNLTKQISRLSEENLELRKKCDVISRLEIDNIQLKQKCDVLQKKYNNQIAINEDVEEAKKVIIEQANEQIDALTKQNICFTKNNEELLKLNETTTRERNNIESDLESERKKISALRTDMEASLKRERDSVASDIIGEIKDQLDHFAKSFAFFRENGTADEDTVNICIDDLNSIILSFEKYDIKPIGANGEIDNFNIAIHHCEESVKPGDKVKIVSIGWKIADTIISKAEVEKLEV